MRKVSQMEKATDRLPARARRKLHQTTISHKMRGTRAGQLTSGSGRKVKRRMLRKETHVAPSNLGKGYVSSAGGGGGVVVETADVVTEFTLCVSMSSISSRASHLPPCLPGAGIPGKTRRGDDGRCGKEGSSDESLHDRSGRASPLLNKRIESRRRRTAQTAFMFV